MTFPEDLVPETLPSGHRFADDAAVMLRALQVARQGIGYVEPNPAVGAVIVDKERRLIAEGYHQHFGGPHAEIHAIRNANGATQGMQLFVTLEPCSHFGKTPPCAEAVIAAGFARVVVGCRDPAPHVAGQGIARLQAAGMDVAEDICGAQCRRLIAPFESLFCRHRPWVHAKWAMTLDGRLASSSGHSQWISGEQSRRYVHRLRGQMDAIITGAGTVRADNPRLTARPPGPRTALRVVLDASGQSVSTESALMASLPIAPLLVCAGPNGDRPSLDRLVAAGSEVLECPVNSAGRIELPYVMDELARRRCTNVLLEAGPEVLGAFFDQNLIDEVHAFIAPKLVGGRDARPVIGGQGFQTIPHLPSLHEVTWQSSGIDMLCHGDVRQ